MPVSLRNEHACPTARCGSSQNGIDTRTSFAVVRVVGEHAQRLELLGAASPPRHQLAMQDRLVVVANLDQRLLSGKARARLCELRRRFSFGVDCVLTCR